MKNIKDITIAFLSYTIACVIVTYDTRTFYLTNLTLKGHLPFYLLFVSYNYRKAYVGRSMCFEKDSEGRRKGKRDRQSDRDRGTDRDRNRHRQRGRRRQRDRESATDRDSHRETETETAIDREKQRETVIKINKDK